MLIVLLVLVVSYLTLIKRNSTQLAARDIGFDLTKNESVLFVVSHPDDECIFFSPTILHLKEKCVKVHLLCLSSGNFYGEGTKRIRELLASCDNLGIAVDRVFAVNNFEDNPKLFWNHELVADVVQQHLIKTGATSVFTFDDNGVSGHPNHISAFSGVRHLLQSGTAGPEIKAYALVSVSLPRKYIQVCDIFFSIFETILNKSILVASSPSNYFTAYNSMLRHQSQLVWYRRLFIIFSRYMFMNTWKKVE